MKDQIKLLMKLESSALTIQEEWWKRKLEKASTQQESPKEFLIENPSNQRNQHNFFSNETFGEKKS